MLSVCTPTFVSTKSFPWVTRKCTWVQTVPLTVLIGGIIKCKVLPPRNLYHPVLPYKSNYRVMFPLCSACDDTMNQGNFTHTDEELCIVGTWVVDEVR